MLYLSNFTTKQRIYLLEMVNSALNLNLRYDDLKAVKKKFFDQALNITKVRMLGMPDKTITNGEKGESKQNKLRKFKVIERIAGKVKGW